MSAVMAPPGWYPINPTQIGYWDGVAWAWLPPPVVAKSPLGEPLRELHPLVSVAACVAGIGVPVGLGVVVSKIVGEVDWPDWTILVAGFLTVWVGLIAGVVVALRRNGRTLVESLDLPATGRGWLKGVLIGVVAGVVLRFGSGLLAAPFLPFLNDPISPFGQVRGGTYYVQPETSLLVTFALGAVIGAPILEELFFRNVLMPTMARRWALPIAIAVQAGIFALAHVAIGASVVQNLMTVTVIAAVGVGLGMLRQWTRTILTCIVAHATFNLIAVAVIVALPHLEGAGVS
jgi:membrane protease YdiL (CAAX protease family)